MTQDTPNIDKMWEEQGFEKDNGALGYRYTYKTKSPDTCWRLIAQYRRKSNDYKITLVEWPTEDEYIVHMNYIVGPISRAYDVCTYLLDSAVPTTPTDVLQNRLTALLKATAK